MPSFGVSCLLLLLCISQGNCQLQWRKLPSNGASTPLNRRDMALGFDDVNNLLYMYGGRGNSAVGADLWTFNLSSYAWTRINYPGAGPGGRFSVVSGFSTRHKLFVVATGEALPRTKTFLNDIWGYNVTSGQWRLLPARGRVPELRYGASGGLHTNGSSLYVTHGFSSRRYSNTFRYDLDQMRWFTEFEGTHPYSRTSPKPRCLQGGTMVSPDETVFYGGCLSGGSSGGTCPSVDAWSYVRGSTWRPMAECPSPRQFQGMAPWPSKHRKVVMFGGQQVRASIVMAELAPENEVDLLDVASGQWKRLQSVGDPTHGLPGWRAGVLMIPTRNSVLLYGGQLQYGGSPGINLTAVWELTGDIDAAPNAGKCGPRWFAFPHLHGLFMILSWGILLQAGAFIARYFRHRDPLWFIWHQRLQVSGVALGFVGVCLVLPGTLAVPNFAHSILGALIFLWSIQQVINGILRPHKGAGSIEKKRAQWEIFHKWGGRLFLVIALINIFLGLYLVIAPVSVIAIWSTIFTLIVVLYIVFEIRLQQTAPGEVTPMPLDDKKESTSTHYGVGKGVDAESVTSGSNPT